MFGKRSYRLDLSGTCEIAYVEMRSAVARRYREGSFERTTYRRIIRDIGNDWQQLFLIVITSQLVQDAGDIAELYRLRAYDAIHLASGLALQTRAAEPVTFACWDKALELSAIAAKLHVLNRN